MGKQVQRAGKRGALVGLGIVGVLVLVLVGIYINDRRNVGKEGHIIGETAPGQTLYAFQDFVPAYSDSGTLYSLGSLPSAEQDARSQELERAGQIFRVLKGTKVLVVDHKFLGIVSQVRFLEGPRKGGTAWVTDDELVLNP